MAGNAINNTYRLASEPVFFCRRQKAGDERVKANTGISR